MLARRLVLLASIALAACARPPLALRGEYAPITIPQALAHPDSRNAVRWGGTLARTMPEKGRTCFEVVEHPLDRTARPRRTDDSSGRFRACAPGFYDPAVWARGREVTVVGTLAGEVTAKVGGADYRFALVDAAHVELWPERPVYEAAGPAIGVGIGGASGAGVGGSVGIGF